MTRGLEVDFITCFVPYDDLLRHSLNFYASKELLKSWASGANCLHREQTSLWNWPMTWGLGGGCLILELPRVSTIGKTSSIKGHLIQIVEKESIKILFLIYKNLKLVNANENVIIIECIMRALLFLQNLVKVLGDAAHHLHSVWTIC